MKTLLYKIATDRVQGLIYVPVKFLLWVLSLIYGLLILFRKLLYKYYVCSARLLPCPVISVGNITVGGTGKTPVVELLIQVLRNSGKRIVVLTRGYMDKKHARFSDEAEMIKSAFPGIPVLIGADRLRNALKYLKDHQTDFFLLDDGFQHWKIARQLDIVVIDATDPWGNGHLLPRGILRETAKSIRRAQIILLTRTDQAGESLIDLRIAVKTLHPDAILVETIHKPVFLKDLRKEHILDLPMMSGKKVIAVCSIGNPFSFLRTLEQIRVNAVENIAFEDHHVYTDGDIERIRAVCAKSGVSTIITTDKDTPKLKDHIEKFPGNLELLALNIRIEITQGEGAFIERIDHLS